MYISFTCQVVSLRISCLGCNRNRACSAKPYAYTLNAFDGPLSSEYGTHKTVKARFWPWLSGESPHNLSSCSLLARKRYLAVQGGLVFKAHRILYHSTLGLRVIKKRRRRYLAVLGLGLQCQLPVVFFSSSSLLSLQVLEGPRALS